jgi:hypothetical protein
MNRAEQEVTKFRCGHLKKKEPFAFADLGMGGEKEQGRCCKLSQL